VICDAEMADAAANVECAELLDRAGNYFSGRAAYSGARPLCERALAIREKVLGLSINAINATLYDNHNFNFMGRPPSVAQLGSAVEHF
jgi:hypothetical protein